MLLVPYNKHSLIYQTRSYITNTYYYFKLWFIRELTTALVFALLLFMQFAPTTYHIDYITSVLGDNINFQHNDYKINIIIMCR